MPRVNIPVTSIGKAGVTKPTEITGDATNGHIVVGLNTSLILEVHNVHATLPQTITLITPGTVDGNAIADPIRTIPAASVKQVSDLDPSVYGDNLEFTVSTTDIKLSAYRSA